MTSFKELFRLYGLAALWSSTRKLHEDTVELKTKLAITEQQTSERITQVEKRADSERDRILLTRGVPKEITGGDFTPIMPKKKASKFAERIRKSKEREANYFQIATSQSAPLETVIENERKFDSNSLLERARDITTSLN